MLVIKLTGSKAGATNSRMGHPAVERSGERRWAMDRV